MFDFNLFVTVVAAIVASNVIGYVFNKIANA
jgi:hypothetical protein